MLSKLALTLILALFATRNNAHYQLVSTPMKWTDAENRCILLGGHLATILTQTEDNIFSDLCNQVTPTPSSMNTNILAQEACWMGITANQPGWTAGVSNQWNAFKWIDGTPYQSSYHPWWLNWGSYGHLYVGGPVQMSMGDCGFRAVTRDQSNNLRFGWFMTGCTDWSFPFICDINPCPPSSVFPISQAACRALYGCSNLEVLECKPRPQDTIDSVKIKEFPGGQDALFIDNQITAGNTVGNIPLSLYYTACILSIIGILSIFTVIVLLCQKVFQKVFQKQIGKYKTVDIQCVEDEQ